MGEISCDSDIRMQNELHRAEVKLRILNRLRRDAKLLNAERNDILKKMNALQRLDLEVSNLKKKMNKCDRIIDDLESSNAEMQKAMKEVANVDKVNGNLMDKTLLLIDRVENLENLNMNLINEYESLVARNNAIPSSRKNRAINEI